MRIGRKRRRKRRRRRRRRGRRRSERIRDEEKGYGWIWGDYTAPFSQIHCLKNVVTNQPTDRLTNG